MSDVMEAPAESGQGSIEAPADAGQAVEDSGPFFSTDDGHEFKTPNELKEYFRNGTLRHSDYTKKTQTLAEQRKEFESQQKKYQQEIEEFRQKQKQYSSIDAFLKSPKGAAFMKRYQGEIRNPGPQATNEYLEKMLEERIKPIKEQNEQLAKWREDQERQLKREKAYERLKGEYEDFDPNIVQEMSTWVEEMPPGEEEYYLTRLLYEAHKGRQNPAALERKMAQAAEKRNTRKIPNANMGTPPSKGRTPGKNLDQAKMAALAAEGLG